MTRFSGAIGAPACAGATGVEGLGAYSSRPFKKEAGAFLLLLFLAAVYYAALIVYQSVEIKGAVYFLPADDVLIAMNYARTFVRTGELVWFPGAARVEGITSPLWTLLLAGLQLVPISLPASGLLVQALGAVVMLLTLFLVRRLALLIESDRTFAFTASVVVATCFSVVSTALAGWESSAIALLVVALVCIAIAPDRFPIVGYLLIVVGVLLRLDFLVAALPIALYLILRRKAGWLAVLLTLLLPTCLLTIWRWGYYGVPLPNTWFAKMTGFPLELRLMRGLWVTLQDCWRWNVLLIALPFLALTCKRNRDDRTLLPCAVFATQAMYSAFVGGDILHDEMWGSRFLIVALPAFLPVVMGQLSRILASLAPTLSATSRYLIAGALVFVSVSPLDRVLMVARPLSWDAARQVRKALWIREHTPMAAVVGVAQAGVVPYFCERPCVDFLGKCDPVVARMSGHLAPEGLNRFTWFVPGHVKWSARYSIGQLRPDVVAGIWRNSNEWLGVLQEAGYRAVVIDDVSDTTEPIWVRPGFIRESD